MKRDHPTTRARRSGRRRHRPSAEQAPAQRPWQSLVLPYDPVRVLHPEQIEAIHEASLQLLEEQGVVMLLARARALLRQAGLKITDGDPCVRFDRDFVLEAIAQAPSEFTLHARNPARQLQMGGARLNVCSVASAPNASDLDRGRRTGNRADFQNFIRLGQQLNCVHLFGGYPVEPIDLDPTTRHLDAIYDLATLSDKVFTIYSLGRERNLDALEMIRLARGLTHEELDQQPSLVTIINANSPLTYDEPMLTGIIEMALRHQVSVITPFTLAGAMAPVTLAGALAQQNAEALVGIALAQTVRPGAPVVYGGFTSNVDMKSGSPAFGTPEYMLAAQAGGQLARRYQLPYRSSNVCAANSLDAQSAYESVFALWGAVMGGANMLMHGAGWMEGGLCASFEKMILDADLLQMIATYLTPIDVNDDTLALDAIREAGPGGHFFGTAHTQSRYQSAFYAPLLSDWRNFESWQEAGRPDAARKANQVYKQFLRDYEAPPMEPAVRDALDAFVQIRRQEYASKTTSKRGSASAN